MPDYGDINEVASGRNAKGQFVSKQAISEKAVGIINQMNKDLGKQQKLVENLAKAFGSQAKAQGKAAHEQMKSFTQTEKALRHQGSIHEKTTRDVLKNLKNQQKEYANLAHSILKANEQAEKASKSGWHLQLPSILTTTLASVFSAYGIKRIADYVEQLGRVRGAVQALYNLDAAGTPVKRISEFLGGLGGEQARTRLLPQEQLQGIIRLQQTLQRTLGQQGSEKLTSQITGSLQTMKDLAGFSALAKENVGKALEAYSAFDPAAFLTALRAIKQEQDSVNKTANTLEDAWNKIHDAAERFVIDFLSHYGGDVNKAIEGIASGIENLIGRTSDWFSGMKGQWQWLIDVIAVVNKGMNMIIGGIANIPTAGKYAYQAGAGFILAENMRGVDTRIERLMKQGVGIHDPRMQALFAERNKIAGQAADILGGGDIQKVNTTLPAEYMKRFSNETDKAAQEANKLKTHTDDVGASAKALLDKAERLKDALKYTETATLQTSQAMARLQLKESFLSMPTMVEDYLQAASQMGKEIEKISQAMRLVDTQTEEGKQKLLQLDIKRLQLAKEQVETTRKLRDGYVEAIQAQTFGLGFFNKLITSREQNLGMGLDMGLLRANPRFLGRLLGASDPGAEALRWGENGLRGLTSGLPASSLVIPPKFEGLPLNLYKPEIPHIVNPLSAFQSLTRPTPSVAPSTSSNLSGKGASDKLQAAGHLLLSAARDIKALENQTVSGSQEAESFGTYG